MSGMLAKIRSLHNSFSPVQKRLADCIARNSQDVPFQSVHEIAGVTGISIASISRFAREVGCDGFRDLKTQLAKDSLPALDSILRFGKSFHRAPDRNTHRTPSKTGRLPIGLRPPRCSYESTSSKRQSNS